MEPFIGQICLFGFNFAPRGWALCNGQLLPISQNAALFSLIGTTYGGDGRTTFALPDLRGRAPIHYGQGAGLTNRSMGEVSGTENVTLLITQIPAHNHILQANNSGGNAPLSPSTVISNPVDINGDALNAFTGSAANTSLSPTAIGMSGGSQPHNNMQPYLVMNYCIALVGIFPSRD